MRSKSYIVAELLAENNATIGTCISVEAVYPEEKNLDISYYYAPIPLRYIFTMDDGKSILSENRILITTTLGKGTTIHITDQPLQTKSDSGIDTLKALVPDLLTVVQCPSPDDCDQGCDDPDCEFCDEMMKDELWTVVVHLNDNHKWSRAQIADWLDTLDLDLRFTDEDHPVED